MGQGNPKGKNEKLTSICHWTWEKKSIFHINNWNQLLFLYRVTENLPTSFFCLLVVYLFVLIDPPFHFLVNLRVTALWNEEVTKITFIEQKDLVIIFKLSTRLIVGWFYWLNLSPVFCWSQCFQGCLINCEGFSTCTMHNCCCCWIE